MDLLQPASRPAAQTVSQTVSLLGLLSTPSSRAGGLQLPTPPARWRHSSLSPVTDGAGRRMPLWLRLRSLAHRPSFREAPLSAGFEILRQEAAAALSDLREAVTRQERILALHEGKQSLTHARSVAAFIHYSPLPVVSEMVLRQIGQLRAEGFAVVFISMAPALPPAALERLLPLAALVVHRRNLGLDFGGWHDVAPLLRARAPAMTELLLVNDSLCGPFRPMAPMFKALRSEGDGLFGLTENLAPRPHLQSYFLLGRGQPVVRDMLRFLDEYRVTTSKRLTIRNGEIRFTGWMRARGHQVAAWCGYARVERAALRHEAARRRLRTIYPFLFTEIPEGTASEATLMARALARRPTNATHLFWRELVEDFGFPFVKTDLLLRNPLGIADPMAWRTLLPTESLRERAWVEAHLASQSGRKASSP